MPRLNLAIFALLASSVLRLLTVGETLGARGVFPFLAVWVVMNVAIGTDFLGLAGGAGIAWEAHIGGLLAGFFLMPLFDRPPPLTAV